MNRKIVITNDAPEQLKKLGKEHNDAALRLERARIQRSKWQSETRIARAAHTEAVNKFEKAYVQWDKKESKPDELIELIEVEQPEKAKP